MGVTVACLALLRAKACGTKSQLAQTLLTLALG